MLTNDRQRGSSGRLTDGNSRQYGVLCRAVRPLMVDGRCTLRAGCAFAALTGHGKRSCSPCMPSNRRKSTRLLPVVSLTVRLKRIPSISVTATLVALIVCRKGTTRFRAVPLHLSGSFARPATRTTCMPACQEAGAFCCRQRRPLRARLASCKTVQGAVSGVGRQRPAGRSARLWPDGVVRATAWRSWPPGVGHGSLAAQASRRRVSTALRNSSTPSAGTLPRVQVGWLVGWLKASGWGIRPRIRPVGSVRPAIPSGEPLGLAG